MALNFGSMLGSQGRGNFNLTYRGVWIATSGSILTTFTSGSFSIGNADADRWVICCIYGYDYYASSVFLTTSTICGVTVGNNYVEVEQPDQSGYDYRCIIAWAKVPTGTTGTVVVNFANYVDGITIHTFTCIGGQANYTKTGNAADSSSSVNANNITTADGFLLATSFIGTTGTGNTTFSGNTGLSSTPKIENYYNIRSIYPTLLAIDWIESTSRSTLSLTANTSATEDDPLVIATLSWGDILPSAPYAEYTAGYVSSAGVTSFSQSLNIGTAAENRYVIVVLMIDLSSSGGSPTTVTVNGASTTRVATFGADSDEACAIYITDAPVTSGTTATIATGTVTGGYQIAAAIYAAYGINPTPNDTLVAAEGSDPSGTIDVPANGFIIAGAVTGSAGSSVTWTGVNSVSSNSSTSTYASGYYSNANESAKTGRTITSNWTGGEQGDEKLVAVSWGP
jgi:hypothetical protein